MIPKTIHYCWVGSAPLPKSAQKCIESWKRYCPDYEIIEWNESNYDFTKNKYMRQALEAKKWGFVPDYARLDIIYDHGGIYLDVDVEMIRPFDPLLSLKGFAGFENDHNVALGLGFGAEAGSPVIKALLDSYDRLSFINEDGSLNLIASPALNSDTLETLGLKRNGEEQDLDGFRIFPVDRFCPKSLKDGIIRLTDNSFSIHHYDGSWLDDAGQKRKQKRWKKGRQKRRKAKMRQLRTRLLSAVIGKDRLVKLKKRLGLIK